MHDGTSEDISGAAYVVVDHVEVDLSAVNGSHVGLEVVDTSLRDGDLIGGLVPGSSDID